MTSTIKRVATLLLLVVHCHATTLVVVITSQAIYVGTDGKMTYLDHPEFKSGSVQKAVIFQQRLAVVCLGTCRISFVSDDGTREAVAYDFTAWIAGIEKKCPANVSVADLARILERESGITFNDIKLEGMIIKGTFDGQKPQKSLIDFVILGYDAGVPTVNRVKYEIDWEKRRLILLIKNEHPRADSRVDLDFFIFGEDKVMDSMKTRKGNIYEEIRPLILNELPKLTAGQNLSAQEATNLCLSILRVDAKHLNTVGPPYSITTVVPLGAGSLTQVIYRK